MVLNKVEINCSTGKVTEAPMTAVEEARHKVEVAEMRRKFEELPEHVQRLRDLKAKGWNNLNLSERNEVMERLLDSF